MIYLSSVNAHLLCMPSQGEVTDLAISPDNTLLASSGNDNAARVWSIGCARGSAAEAFSFGFPVAVLLGHQKDITRITFSSQWEPGCRRLITLSYDGTIRVYDCDRWSQAPVVLFAGSNAIPSPFEQQQQLRFWAPPAESDPTFIAPIPANTLGECLWIDIHPFGSEMVIGNNHGGLQVYAVPSFVWRYLRVFVLSSL